MNEQRIQAIKDSLREVMGLLAQRGQPLSDDIKLMLTRVMQHAAQRIQQLRQEEQEQTDIERIESEQANIAEQVAPESEEPPPPNTPELPAAPHPSSNINGFRYDDKTGKLLVKFQGDYPAQNGPIYAYEGVPKHIFDVFRRGAVAPKTSGSNAWHTWKQGVTPSHGAAMSALIKNGGYQYQRVA